MKLVTTKPAAAIQWLTLSLIILLLAVFPLQPAMAAPLSDSGQDVPAAALKLIGFGSDSRTALDVNAVAVLVDYVLGAKPAHESVLPKFNQAPGAYYEFDTLITFPSFIQYAYSGQIPAILTSPSSLRYSLWNGLGGKNPKLPSKWLPVAVDGKPLIIRGLQRDAITPDLNTGVYYEYDLNRTLILLNHRGRQVLITISKQVNVSDVGKKGVILGKDEDWNYYYSGEPGSTKAGMGWVKSYIYDYFSVAVYVETGASPAMVRSGIFQWIRAGWNGINFVQTDHIVKGIKRYAKNSKAILESPNLPPPGQIAMAYSKLSSLPHGDLLDQYAALQQARLAMAVQTGKIDSGKFKKDAYASTSKEQIVEELMLEYLKVALGRPSLVGQKVALAIN